MRQQLVRFETPVAPAEMQTISNKLNALLRGMSSREIETKPLELSTAEEDVVGTTVDILREEEASRYNDHFLAGLRNLLSQPEFEDKDSLEVVIRSVEDGSLGRAVFGTGARWFGDPRGNRKGKRRRYALAAKYSAKALRHPRRDERA